MEGRDPRDPLPDTLDELQEEIRYWTGRVGEGDPGSIWEHRVRERLNSLRSLVPIYLSQQQNKPSHREEAINEAMEMAGSQRDLSPESTSPSLSPQLANGKIFIGHGRSHVWKDLKDFVQDRLRLDWDEFNRESAAGLATTERLQEILDKASFAFLVMTAEDEHSDGTTHARANVIHEAGLFQGRLGFKRAIILLEESCQEFSNIHGLTQIRFPKGNIMAKSEEIRRVLEREGLLKKV